MRPLFPPWSDTLLRVCAAAVVLGGGAALAVPMTYVRTPYGTGQGNPLVQPLKFDHRHHVRDDGIDCYYCHGDARRSPSAGVPSTELCMGCHGNLWGKSPELTLLRESHAADRSVVWQRVNGLPHHVYFPHDVHVKKGVGCVSCHGRVDRMGQVFQAEPLTMEFCLDCHRDPAPRLRPPAEVTNMEWQPPADENEARALGEQLVRDGNVHAPVECSECHR